MVLLANLWLSIAGHRENLDLILPLHAMVKMGDIEPHTGIASEIMRRCGAIN